MEVVTKKSRGRPPKEVTASGAERTRKYREKKKVEQIAKAKVTAKEPRKAPSNSADALVKAMVNAALPNLMPPIAYPITDSALPMWEAIITARARDDWTDPDLVVAAQLAQVQADLRAEETAIRLEGRIIVDYLGKTTKNPRFDVVDMLSKRALSLMRALHMGGKSGAAPRGFVGARNIERESRKLRTEIEDDDLLA